MKEPSPIRPDENTVDYLSTLVRKLWADKSRESGDPYCSHPEAVAELAASMVGEEKKDLARSAGWAHDIIEDWPREKEVHGLDHVDFKKRKEYLGSLLAGSQIARSVLYIVDKLSFQGIASERAELRRVFEVDGSDDDLLAALVRIADYAHNLRPESLSRTMQTLQANKAMDYLVTVMPFLPDIRPELAKKSWFESKEFDKVIERSKKDAVDVFSKAAAEGIEGFRFGEWGINKGAGVNAVKVNEKYGIDMPTSAADHSKTLLNYKDEVARVALEDKNRLRGMSRLIDGLTPLERSMFLASYYRQALEQEDPALQAAAAIDFIGFALPVVINYKSQIGYEGKDVVLSYDGKWHDKTIKENYSMSLRYIQQAAKDGYMGKAVERQTFPLLDYNHALQGFYSEMQERIDKIEMPGFFSRIVRLFR